jgi:hypothetical protein
VQHVAAVTEKQVLSALVSSFWVVPNQNLGLNLRVSLKQRSVCHCLGLDKDEIQPVLSA